MLKAKNGIVVKKGQIWNSNDPRRESKSIEVVKVNKKTKQITATDMLSGKESVHSLSRFVDNTRGYSLLTFGV